MSSTQMLKGILDGCLLALIAEEEVYGYELATKLATYGFADVSEGTIYPLLMRMQKLGWIEATQRQSPSGPKRKYYAITSAGRDELTAFSARWYSLSASVNQILKEE
ncbi:MULTISPECIES: PadR family transcriptional regulator [Exiguobacterium]|uniref:PadR family transcriptional regulator n=1 Tax=Exiguobacterium oxidotolerans TaxID=223958 RepID=A0A653IHF3_9BACL|nr:MULTISPECIES: PadR family transcriptional regulator [Exiguobacterium]ASI35294.1 PadR family transcriptional regulator [Exiguobacterium sp. N4-1P]ASI37307.1 PadR family transcriptional regulator [Exiguobacterium sp. N4-1P]VWX38722.1 PadR family transcriptional regulator [Exiguobacterium oxidotolerans]